MLASGAIIVGMEDEYFRALGEDCQREEEAEEEMHFCIEYGVQALLLLDSQGLTMFRDSYIYS